MALTFDKVANKTWGKDDIIDLTSSSYSGAANLPEKKSVPGWYQTALRRFLDIHTDDTAFIVSTGDGDGFGSILCVEESCYQDIVLGRSPELADGGRSRGFGSFDAFAEHCIEPEHAAARADRIKMTGRLITADRNASPGPSSQADIKPSPYRLPAPPLASSSSRPIKPPPSSATVANASASGSRAVAKPAPISPQSSLDLFDFGFGLPSSKAARKPVQTERFVLSSSPEPMPNRKPLALSNGKLVGRTSSYKPGKRPAELIELSDSSDEDFIARAAQFDKMNGLDRKKTKTGSPVPRPGPRKKFRPELVVGKGKARASSPDFGEREAWASHDAASQMARDKEQALRDVERLEAADRARAVGAAPAGQANAAAGPSNAGAAGRAPAAAAAAAAAVAPAAFVPGHASPAELNVMRQERERLTGIVGIFTSIHPAFKAANPLLVVRYNELMIRLSQLSQKAASAQRIEPLDPRLAELPPVNQTAPGVIPEIIRKVAASYLPLIGDGLRQLTVFSTQLKNLYAARPLAPPAAMPAYANGFGYGGTLAGMYDPIVDALTGRGAYGYGYPPEEVGDANFRAPGDLKDFFAIAAADFGESEVVAEAARKLSLDDHTKDKLPGLQITLMPHQIQGVAWMLGKEQDAKCKGGIMADDMGLGKTVQALGVMVANRPERDESDRTTLIVCPFALLDQWKLEIESKCTPNLFKIHVQHGKDKLNKVAKLKRFDVIITTYATLVQDFPDYRKHATARKKAKKARKEMDDFVEDDSDSDWKSSLKKGPLAQMVFHRVVLDEAQQIRNRNTRAAQACFDINAEYRWALTGTPVTNGLEDLYSLLKFLNVRPWNEWSEYNAHVVKRAKRKPALAASRAQAILKFCLIRRNKDSKIDGVPILTLKPKHIREDLLDFTPDERKIYTALEQRSRAKFNSFLKKGTVMRNYTQVLTLLLRLRQAANHPILLVRAKHEARPDDIMVEDDDEVPAAADGLAPDDAAELARATAANGAAWVAKHKKTLFDRALNATIAELDGEEIDDEAWACAICFEDSRISEEVITACGHRFCRACVTDVLQQVQQVIGENDIEQANKRPCPSCRSPFDLGMIFATAPLEPTEAELDAELKRLGKDVAADQAEDDDEDVDMSGSGANAVGEFARGDKDIKPFLGKKAGGKSAGASSTAVKGKGKGRVLDSDDEDFAAKDEPAPWWQEDRIMMDPRHRQHRKKLYESLGLEDDDVIQPSTKMKALLALLKTNLAECPDDKIVVYSQWTTMLDLVADYLRTEKVSYDIYDGRMNRKEREETIRAFNGRKNPQVLLLSLKAGGVGLNLVRANRVVNLDLAWNAATETQARDRVHRLGQQKEVFVNRLIVADTVEQRVLALQERKQKESDAALGEGTGAKLKRMTVQDLQALFG